MRILSFDSVNMQANFEEGTVNPKAICLAHQKLGITNGIIGEEIIKVVTAAGERATDVKKFLRQFAEGAVVGEKSHAPCKENYWSIPDFTNIACAILQSGCSSRSDMVAYLRSTSSA